MMEDLVDLKGHGLTWPHIRDLAEPAIWIQEVSF